MSQDLTVLVPSRLRDERGVELDDALLEIGARIVRELPRTDPREAVLLVQYTAAPEHLRGRRVRPVWFEPVADDPLPEHGEQPALILDRWELVQS